VGNLKTSTRGNGRPMGYFEILWVVDGNASMGTKSRVGSGLILEEFILGLLEPEISLVTVLIEFPWL
jgi:hypothetical protein